MLNLNAGTLITKSFTKTAGATAYLNFNGGTLQSAASSTTFLPALTAVYLNGAFGVNAGGLVMNTAGFDDTIAANLLAPAGNGVATIPVLTSGSGYVGAPHISITGGGGTGATAIANMVDDGTGKSTLRIDSVTITNPGVNYTGTPTLTLTGGGAVTAATFDTVTTSANTSGGLTKQGLGTLTLTGATTYTGATTVSAGTLVMPEVSSSSVLSVADGAALAITGSTGAQLGSGGVGSSLTLGSTPAAGTGTSLTLANFVSRSHPADLHRHLHHQGRRAWAPPSTCVATSPAPASFPLIRSKARSSATASAPWRWSPAAQRHRAFG